MVFFKLQISNPLLRFLLRRILLFIPTLIVISLLAFIISANSPGDPVERMMNVAEAGGVFGSQNATQLQQQKLWTHKLGLDLPPFYLSMVPLSFPDTLFKIYNREERAAAKSLLYQFGNWNAIQNFQSSLHELYLKYEQLKLDSASENFSDNEIHEVVRQSRSSILSLLNSSQVNIITAKLNESEKSYVAYPFLSPLEGQLQLAEKNFEELQASSQRWKNFIPVIHFYPNNQYHRWLFGDGVYSKGMIRGDLGISYTTQEPVLTIIKSRIGWSLLFTLLSVILAYLISIPIGIRAAVRRNSFFDRGSSVILFLLYSMPAFWVATLLLFLFANPDVLHWFPASGVKPVTGYPNDASLPEKIKLSLPYLILPLIAYTYSSLAFLSKLTRSSMIEVLHQDFIRTASAKGLSQRTVIWRHAFRNALLPLITVFANLFPALIGGSVILESIFTIPGMGYETYLAMQNQNYPMIIGVFTLAGVLTLAGYLVGDILYALADSRISFSRK